MPVNIGDIVRITARMLLDGTFDVNNVFHFKVRVNSTVDDDSFMTSVALTLDNHFTLVSGNMSNRITFDKVEGVNVTQNVLLPPKDFPSLVSGSSTSEMLPETVAGCVYFRTTRPKTRASKFIGTFTETGNVGGLVSSAVQTTLLNFGTALLNGTAVSGVGLDFGAYNKPLDRFTQVATVVVPNRWRTQKRRRIGVGS